MNDTIRMILIALGVAILVLILVPSLVMVGMMTGMSGMNGMGGGDGAWLRVVLVVIVVLIGVALLAIGTSRRR
jgi:hypothetical protein